MKLCRICLYKDGRLYPITSHGLNSLYQQLTGGFVKVDVDRKLPQWVCAECGLRLMSYDKLRQKSLQAHQILCQLLDKASNITEEDINHIDREKYNLKSNLSYSLIDFVSTPKDSNYIIDNKPNLNVKFIDLIEGETTADVKTENDSSNDSLSDTENSLEFDNDLPDSGNASNSKDSVKKLLKTRDKKFKLKVKKQVNRYLKLFKLNPKKVKKEIKNEVVDEIAIEIDDIFAETLPMGVEKEEITFESLPAESETAKISTQPNDRAYKKYFQSNTDLMIDEFFTVQRLTLEEQKARQDRRKFTATYIEAPFKCDECFRGFYSEVAYTRHQYYHSDSRGKYQCAICKIRFRLNTSYLHHANSHKALYHCKQCKFTSTNRPAAKNHSFKHKGKVYKCAQCPAQFSFQSSYLSHLRLVHVSKFACEICGYSFVSERGVYLHKSFKHALEKDDSIVPADGPACSTCSIRFFSDEALKTHMRVSHKSGRRKRNEDNGYPVAAKNVVCEICGVKTASGRQYRGHFRRCHPNEKSSLPARNMHGGTSAMCEHCGRVFKHKHNLQKHAMLHTGKKPYECDYCHKKFSIKPLVLSHIVNCHLPKKKDKPEKLFPCSICGKMFANSGNRVRHMVTHSDLRPYSCEICGSSFKTKGEVKAHTTHVHLKVPWPKKQPRATGHADLAYL